MPSIPIIPANTPGAGIGRCNLANINPQTAPVNVDKINSFIFFVDTFLHPSPYIFFQVLNIQWFQRLL